MKMKMKINFINILENISHKSIQKQFFAIVYFYFIYLFIYLLIYLFIYLFAKDILKIFFLENLYFLRKNQDKIFLLGK